MSSLIRSAIITAAVIVGAGRRDDMVRAALIGLFCGAAVAAAPLTRVALAILTKKEAP